MYNSQPLISVILPFYNVAPYLYEAIESIRAQSFQNWECILIDDGSTDGSGAIAEEFLSDERFRLVRHEYNEGIVKSLNDALWMARGKYIARMDGDDISMPKRLEWQYHFLEKHPHIAMVWGSVEIIESNGKKQWMREYLSDPQHIRARILYDLGILHGASLVRRSVYDTIGMYREEYRYIEDVDWIFRAVFSGFLVSNLSEVVLQYRKRPNSSEKNARKKVIESYRLKRALIAEYCLTPSFKEWCSVYAHLILGWILSPRMRDALFRFLRRYI